MNKITVKNIDISITGISDDDFICLTDLAKIKNEEMPNDVIRHWLRRVDTLNYLHLWESMNNPNFKPADFGGFKSKPGENAFIISPQKWIEMTNSVGIRVKSGRYNGGTYAYRDIALEFASWISVEVRLYVIKEFQRLKNQESEQLEWNGKRMLTKLNYLIQTDAVKEHLVPVELSYEQKSYIYANEADLLNVALFGQTAKEWREVNPGKEGNIRDYANTIELAILSNLEFLNAQLITNKIQQKERLIILNKEANREKELFNKNNEKPIKRIEKK